MLRLLPGIVFILITAVMAATPSLAAARELTDQTGFASPGQAMDALVTAVQDNNDSELLAILGPGSEDLISSGDPVADRNGRTRFLKAYLEKHRLEQVNENEVEFFVGSNDYPFPIPVIRQDTAWFFDTPAGREEILNRRIGRNELHTIDVIQAYTDAQREYACMKPNGTTEFARNIASSQGKKDGLYWPVEEGEQESPFGPLIARATKEGYTGDLDEVPPEPFHGYYFKILKAQGEHANGGAFDYAVDGKMILGFGLVAYPAKYGASGIMTFITNQEGVIYEKDMGGDTTATASAMTVFDPDTTWHKYQEADEE